MVNYLRDFSLTPPIEAVYRRLGYKKRSTELPQRARERIDHHIDRGLALCDPQAVWEICDFTVATDSIVIADHITMESENLKSFLAGYGKVVIMGSTAGSKITQAAKEKIEDSPFAAVIYDAVGSEVADSVLNRLMKHLNRILTPKGKKLSRNRYSPGYGDLDLSVQRDLYLFLDMENIGVVITENYQLVPEKSVIAIAGVERK